MASASASGKNSKGKNSKNKQRPMPAIRRPPAAVALDAFVAGAQTPESPAVQASERPVVQAPERPAVPQEAKSAPSAAPRAVVTRADGSERRRMTLYLPPALARRLAVYCAGAERDLSDVVTEAVAGWLDAQAAGRPGG